MSLPDEFLVDFPHDSGLLVVIGPDNETVSATKDLFFDKVDWRVTGDLREAAELIVSRDEQTPTGVDISEHWYHDPVIADAGIVEGEPDPVTLLALSHVQDKGPEVAVSGVIGLVWDESEGSAEIRSGYGDLFGQILGRALLLDAEQVISLIEPSV